MFHIYCTIKHSDWWVTTTQIYGLDKLIDKYNGTKILNQIPYINNLCFVSSYKMQIYCLLDYEFLNVLMISEALYIKPNYFKTNKNPNKIKLFKS